MAFFTMFKRPKSNPVPTGTRYDKTYQMKIDQTGHKELEVTGKTDRYEKIQQFKDECMIENILAKATIDPTVLEQKKAEYFDATGLPTTLAEAQSKILDIKNEFYKLPVTVRESFDNSPEKYIATYGTASWAKYMGIIKEEVENMEEKKETEVNENESK